MEGHCFTCVARLQSIEVVGWAVSIALFADVLMN